jgi:L-lactate dehydrogenase complex protein LldE
MRITLFIPCFIDQIYPQVGIHMADIFERLGHTIEYPDRQTCCGQPPFNTGFWDEARAVAEHALDCFAGAEVIVGPSGSCGAMMRVFYPQLFAGHPREREAIEIASKTYEFSDFLVNQLGVTELGATFSGKVTFHDGCHGLRELGIKEAPRRLLAAVKGLELVEMQEAETCCGFGGTFSVKYPMISSAMAEVKCASIVETGADYVVSNDSSCLMQIQGLLDRQKRPIKCLHLTEILASR